MTSHGEIKTIANATFVSFFFQEDSQQHDGHSSDLDQKRSGILLMITNTQSSDPRVHYPEECSKAKDVESYQYISVSMVIRLKLFSNNNFC